MIRKETALFWGGGGYQDVDSVTEIFFLILGIAFSWKTLSQDAREDLSTVKQCLDTYQAKR